MKNVIFTISLLLGVINSAHATVKEDVCLSWPFAAAQKGKWFKGEEPYVVTKTAISFNRQTSEMEISITTDNANMRFLGTCKDSNIRVKSDSPKTELAGEILPGTNITLLSSDGMYRADFEHPEK